MRKEDQGKSVFLRERKRNMSVSGTVNTPESLCNKLYKAPLGIAFLSSTLT